METNEHAASQKPQCPPYCLPKDTQPTIFQLRNHPLNVISVCCKDCVIFITVQTDEGCITVIYKDITMKLLRTLFRKNVFLQFHRNYIMHKRYIAGCQCNAEEGYDVQMHYGPDVKVSKLQRKAFRNSTGVKPCQMGN